MSALISKALLFTCSLLLAASTLAQKNASEDELLKLQSSISKVMAELASTRTERNSLARVLEQSEQAIARVQQSIVAIKTQVRSAQENIADLQSQALTLENQRQEQQGLIADYLRSAHISSKDSPLKLLLNQEDFTLSSRLTHYYQYLSAARIEQISAYRETLSQISEVSTNISLNADKLRLELDSLAAEEQDLNAKNSQRQDLLEELDVRLSSGGAELARLERQRDELETLLEELRSSIANLDMGDEETPFANMKSRLPWPVEGSVLIRFGTKHKLGDLTWEGISIAAHSGVEVKAIHHGRVVFADWLGSSGLLLIIDHGDGYMSLYAHNQALYKSVGEWVDGGETIAAVGNTGGQKDSGLYFEIRRNGQAQDPVSWFASKR